jgi:hypothetical protein
MKPLSQKMALAAATGAVSLSLAAPFAQAGPLAGVLLKPGIKISPAAVKVRPDAAAVQLDSDVLKVIRAQMEAENAIKAKAQGLGGAFTGNKVSDLEYREIGYRIRYQNCDIYYMKETGAHEVHGAIRDKFNELKDGKAGIGFPTTDETGTPDAQGRYNHFQNGSIYWHPSTGPMMVKGGIRDSWSHQGWELGGLGYPTSDEWVIGPNERFSDFQNGVRYWQMDRGQVEPVTVRLSRDQMVSVVRKMFEQAKNNDDIHVRWVSLHAVSDTGYDFWHSRNRIVMFKINGWHYNFWKDTNYTITLPLLMTADREDNQDVLRVSLAEPATIEANGSPWTGPVARGLRDGIQDAFGQPIELKRAPAGGLLSLKIMPDGSLTLYVRPMGDPERLRSLLQDELNALAG